MAESFPPAQGLYFSETKGASLLAYNAVVGETYRFPDGKQWQVAELYETTLTGFRAVLLKTDGKTILAYAGTNPKSIADIATDIAQATGDLPAQYTQAVSRAATCKAKASGNFFLTGHSLGGGLAAYAGMMTRTPATTVNPAPLNFTNAAAASIIGNSKLVTNYIAGVAEVVSASQGFLIGNKIHVTPGESNPLKGFFTNHALENAGTGVDFPVKV